MFDLKRFEQSGDDGLEIVRDENNGEVLLSHRMLVVVLELLAEASVIT
jgi:hypothetical protein